MSFTTTQRRNDYLGNGSTATYSYTFKIFDATHLEVIRTNTATGVETTLIYPTDYSVTGVGRAAGGSITLTAGVLATGQKLSIIRKVPLTQPTDLRNLGGYFPDTTEDELDRRGMIDLQQQDQIDRSIKVPRSTDLSVVSTELPKPEANRVPMWNDTATALVNRSASDLVTVTGFSNWRTDTFNGTGAQTTFTLTADPGNVNNMDVSVDGITMTPGVDFSVSGTTLTFLTGAPPVGTNNVCARYGFALPQAIVDAGSVNFIQSGTGAVSRTVQDKAREQISVFDFMTAAEIADVKARTATINVLPKLNNAKAALNALGGGRLILPPGRYRIDGVWEIGNGSNSDSSTIDNRLEIVGAGIGAGAGVTNQQNDAPTEIYYNGTIDQFTPVLNLGGPLHNIILRDFRLNANARAGGGLQVIHVTNFHFERVEVINQTHYGMRFTTRNGFPLGCAYGCGNGFVIDPYVMEPANNTANGLIFTSGVNPASSLAGYPDSANIDVMGGYVFYGGSTNSGGCFFDGADNNIIQGTQFLAKGGNDGGGKSVVWGQWPGSPDFPKENTLVNIGAAQPMTGTPGTGGNYAPAWQEDDGLGPITTDNFSGHSHKGTEYVNGIRVYRVRQTAEQTLNNSLQSRTNATFADVPGLVATLNNVKANSRLRVSFTGRAAKSTTGVGQFRLRVNSVDYGETLQEVLATGASTTVAIFKALAAATGTNTVSIQFAGDGTNAVQISHATLTVEELF